MTCGFIDFAQPWGAGPQHQETGRVVHSFESKKKVEPGVKCNGQAFSEKKSDFLPLNTPRKTPDGCHFREILLVILLSSIRCATLSIRSNRVTGDDMNQSQVCHWMACLWAMTLNLADSCLAKYGAGNIGRLVRQTSTLQDSTVAIARVKYFCICCPHILSKSHRHGCALLKRVENI